MEWLASGSWPDGHLSPDAPAEAHRALANALALSAALEGQNKRAVAEEADLAHSTVYDLLRGATYGDVITLARLEAVLRTPLWPKM